MTAPAIVIRGFDFAYPDGTRVLRGLNLEVPAGARCLLLGANGTGKTTLLTVLAGRHLVPEPAVRVLGRSAFADTSLAERVSFIGGPFPFDVDVGVGEILDRLPADPSRRDRLLAVLGVEPRWRMSRISDGQRRRVQILLGLLAPRDVLLLDEVTTDLDVIARADLLAFLRRETEERGATLLYATHILDGLEGWATHLALLAEGGIQRMDPIADVHELARLRAAGAASPLLRLVEGWLRGTPV